MADSNGTSASGRPLADWPHVEQSIATILTTPIGSRVMRRDFGCALTDLVDARMTSRNVLAAYAAAAVAIDRWEPRFRVSRARIETVNEQGRIALQLFGVYFPRGHLGDYSAAQDQSTRVVIGAAS